LFDLMMVGTFVWALFGLDMEKISDVRVSVLFAIGALCLLASWLAGCGLDDLLALFGKSHYCRLKDPGFGIPVMGLAILLRRALASMGYGRSDE
jgi:hypothetical protein